MGKDPAFLFYPNDWVGGTMGMTFEQKGAYLELLMMQFNQGKFTEAQAEQVLNKCFASAWHMVKQKFKTDGTYYWNVRLAAEIERRQLFSLSRRNNAKGKASAEHMPEHMETATENENINVFEIKNVISFFEKTKKFSSEKKLNKSATKFFNNLTAKGYKQNGKNDWRPLAENWILDEKQEPQSEPTRKREEV